MSNISLVIRISENSYKATCMGSMLPSDVENVVNAIKDGIPLPKGHGGLIDADALKKHKYHDNDRYENAVAVAQIDWADTIIEADKAEGEDKK